MEEKTEFRIISAKQHKNLILSKKQVKILIEGLEHFKKYVDDVQASKIYKDFKYEEINNTKEFLEQVINWDYEKACNKCINKQLKKEEDTGVETFAWMDSDSELNKKK